MLRKERDEGHKMYQLDGKLKAAVTEMSALYRKKDDHKEIPE